MPQLVFSEGRKGEDQQEKSKSLFLPCPLYRPPQEGVARDLGGSFDLGYFWGPSVKGQRSWPPFCHQEGFKPRGQ